MDVVIEAKKKLKRRVTLNWIDRNSGVGASFVRGGGGRGLGGDKQKHAIQHANGENSKKAIKRRITKTTTTPTYGGLGGCDLDTVAGWGWRIFLCEGRGFWDGPDQGHVRAV